MQVDLARQCTKDMVSVTLRRSEEMIGWAVQREQGAPVPLEQLIAHLKSRVERLKEIVPVDSVYLYGSYARGCPGRYSDVDLAVVPPVFGNDIIGEGVMLMNVLKGRTFMSNLGHIPARILKTQRPAPFYTRK